jgi:hypothetical protein
VSIEITKKIVDQMRVQGNRPGLVEIYRREMRAWALGHSGTADAKALDVWLPKFPSRPFYTARELVPLFPALGLALGYTKVLQGQKSSARLANELHFCKLPVLMNANGTSRFRHPVYVKADNEPQEFFIVEHIHKWRTLQVTQADFEKEFAR